MVKLLSAASWKENKSFYILLTSGILLRLGFIYFQGLSNDELSAWYRTRYMDFDTLWYFGVKSGDMHPGFYQVLLWFWVNLFGNSEWSIRSTSLVFFVLNLGLIYGIACRFFTKYAGLLIVAFYVSLSFLIVNTTTARPYNSGVFFILLAFYSILDVHQRQEKVPIYTWLILSFAFLGAMTSHYFSFLTVGVLGIVSFSFINKKQFTGLAVAGVLASIAFYFHLPTTFHQLGKGGLGWLGQPDFFWWADFIRQTFQDSWWMFLIAMALVFYVKNNTTHMQENQKFALKVALFLGIVSYVVSVVYTPILRELVFQFFLPFLFFGLLGPIDNWKVQDGKLKSYLPFFVVILFSFHSIFVIKIYGSTQFGEFKKIGENQNEILASRKSKNVTLAENFNEVAYLNYYLDSAVTEEIPDWADHGVAYKLHERAKYSKTAFFLYNWSNNYHVPMYLECIRRYFPRMAKQQDYFNSGTYLFSRLFEDKVITKREIAEVFEGGVIEGEEFFGEFKISVADLRAELQSNEYLLLEGKAQIEKMSRFHFVAIAERAGIPIQEGDHLLSYWAYNQLELVRQSGMAYYFMAFPLSDKLQNSDTIKIYCWNPEKGEVILNNLKLYAVKV